MTTHTVKMAKATKQDFKNVWRLHTSLKTIAEDAYIPDQVEWFCMDDQSRAVRNAIELVYLVIDSQPGAFGRVLMAAETLVNQACDPDLDYLDFNKEIKEAAEIAERVNRGTYLRDMKELDAHRKDLEQAAGELMIDLPEPGTTIAKLLRANSIMRRQRDKAIYADEYRLHCVNDEMPEETPFTQFSVTVDIWTKKRKRVPNCYYDFKVCKWFDECGEELPADQVVTHWRYILEGPQDD